MEGGPGRCLPRVATDPPATGPGPGPVVSVSATSPAAAEAFWRVLSDPWSYPAWVCGTRQVRTADPGWPAVGAELHHRFGPPPVPVRDRTTVLALDPGRWLAMRARARPWAVVRAEICLTRTPGGTVVAITERLEQGPGLLLPRLARAVQRWRNRRSLEALCALAEQRPPRRGRALRTGGPAHRGRR